MSRKIRVISRSIRDRESSELLMTMREFRDLERDMQILEDLRQQVRKETRLLRRIRPLTGMQACQKMRDNLGVGTRQIRHIRPDMQTTKGSSPRHFRINTLPLPVENPAEAWDCQKPGGAWEAAHRHFQAGRMLFFSDDGELDWELNEELSYDADLTLHAVADGPKGEAPHSGPPLTLHAVVDGPKGEAPRSGPPLTLHAVVDGPKGEAPHSALPEVGAEAEAQAFGIQQLQHAPAPLPRCDTPFPSPGRVGIQQLQHTPAPLPRCYTPATFPRCNTPDPSSECMSIQQPHYTPAPLIRCDTSFPSPGREGIQKLHHTPAPSLDASPLPHSLGATPLTQAPTKLHRTPALLPRCYTPATFPRRNTPDPSPECEGIQQLPHTPDPLSGYVTPTSSPECKGIHQLHDTPAPFPGCEEWATVGCMPVASAVMAACSACEAMLTGVAHFALELLPTWAK
eukprot:gene12471-15678_t